MTFARYRCLISYRTKLPGASLETAFSDEAVESFRAEHRWVLEALKEEEKP